MGAKQQKGGVWRAVCGVEGSTLLLVSFAATFPSKFFASGRAPLSRRSCTACNSTQHSEGHCAMRGGAWSDVVNLQVAARSGNHQWRVQILVRLIGIRVRREQKLDA